MRHLPRRKLVRPVLLHLLALEDRSVPAAISGTVFNDLDADGIIDAGEAGQGGVVIYSDANGNSVLDASATSPSSPNVPVTISASGAPTVTSTLTVAGSGTITDVNVKISITHTWDNDLSVFITSPAGTKVELTSANGGSSDNYTNTVFDDEAAVSITSGTAPFTGTFKPEGVLANIDGQTAKGTWTLTVSDGANQDGGTLTAWSLVLTTSSEATAITNASGAYSFSGLADGSYTLRQVAPPSGQVQTFPALNDPQVVTVAGADVPGINFGNRLPPVTLTGTAYADADADGVFDAGESALANVTVFLDANQNGTPDGGEASTVTNASGVYTFSDIAAGKSYFIAAVTPAGGTLTAPIRNGLVVLPPVNASKSINDDNETTVAIDPTNPSRIFSASNIASGANVRAMVSTNAGASFATRLMPSGDVGIPNTFCDANTAWDKFGNLWMTYLDQNTNCVLARSTNGGASFTLIQNFGAGAADHPAIAVGPSATAGQQTLCFEYAASGIRLVMMQINAAGIVGSVVGPTLVPSSSGFNYGDVVVGPNGQVGVTYMNSGGQGPGNLYFNLDPDGTGAAAIGAQSVITSTNVGGFDYITPQPDRSIDAEPDLAWDTSGGPNNGRLYLLYTDEIVDEGNDTEIFIRYSTNNGGSWTPRIRVNDDATTRSQFISRLALDNTTGNLAASFYDSRNSATNSTAEYYATASFDGGVTWAPNVKLSTGVSNVVGGGSFDFGDYNDIDFVQGRFVTTWGDNSNSTGDNPSGTASQDVYLGRVDVANNVKNHYVASAVAGTTYSGLNFGFTGVTSTPPAKVTATEFNPGEVQRSRVTSLRVTFDQVVTATAAAFTLTNQTTLATVGLTATTIDNSLGYSVITLGFTSGPLNFGSLADGRYTLGITASLVTGAGGDLDGDGNGSAGGDYTLAGNTANGLFRLFGDINSDGTVDGSTDFAQFGGVFGTTLAGSAFDFNNDGTIDGTTDFAEFGGRFGFTI